MKKSVSTLGGAVVKARRGAKGRTESAPQKAFTAEQLYEEAYWRVHKKDLQERLGMSKADYKAENARRRRIRSGEEKPALSPEARRDCDEFWREMEEAGGPSETEYNATIADIRRQLAKEDNGKREKMSWEMMGITAEDLRRMKREGRLVGPLPAFAREEPRE